MKLYTLARDVHSKMRIGGSRYSSISKGSGCFGSLLFRGRYATPLATCTDTLVFAHFASKSTSPNILGYSLLL
jgi:hypothetical protein